MKGERRHELERNELADWLAKAFEQIRPYQNAILGAVLLVVVATVGYSWWARQSAGREIDAWNRFQGALGQLAQGNPNPEDFEDIVADHPTGDAASWARVVAADLHLAVGCDLLFKNKSLANQELREAKDHYLAILEADGAGSDLRQRATFGLARTRESQGKLKEAMEHYQAVGENWPEGAYAGAARRRLEDLKQAQTRELYDRFAKFEPQPLTSPDPGVSDQPPAFDLDTLRDDEPPFELQLPNLQESGVEDSQPDDTPESPTTPSDTPTDTADAPSTDPTPTATKPGETGKVDTEVTDPESTDAPKADPGEADTPEGETGKSDPAKSNTPETDTTEADTTEADTTEADTTEADTTDTDPADSPQPPPESTDPP